MNGFLSGLAALAVTAMISLPVHAPTQPAAAQPQAQKTLKIQTSWPAAAAPFDQMQAFAKRLEVVTGGRIKMEALPGGQIVPPFEVLDATHKKVIDGAHSWPGYWVGRNKAAILFTGGPAGPWGMDHIDFMSWMWHGGGFEMMQKFYRETMKMNVISIPMHTTSPPASGLLLRTRRSLSWASRRTSQRNSASNRRPFRHFASSSSFSTSRLLIL